MSPAELTTLCQCETPDGIVKETVRGAAQRIVPELRGAGSK